MSFLRNVAACLRQFHPHYQQSGPAPAQQPRQRAWPVLNPGSVLPGIGPLGQLPRQHQQPAGTPNWAGAFQAAQPIYVQIDHPATRTRRHAAVANARFEGEMQAAQEKYGRRVQFRRIEENGVTVGYVMRAHQHAADQRDGRRPTLFLAGDGKVSHNMPCTISSSTVATLPVVSGDAGFIDTARVLRYGYVEQGHLTSHTPPGRQVPNLRLSPDALQPMATAEYLNKAGRSRNHKEQVEVFVPAPGANVSFSTIGRLVNPHGEYGTLVYAHP